MTNTEAQQRIEELQFAKEWHEEVHGVGDWAKAYPSDAKELDTLVPQLSSK